MGRNKSLGKTVEWTTKSTATPIQDIKDMIEAMNQTPRFGGRISHTVTEAEAEALKEEVYRFNVHNKFKSKQNEVNKRNALLDWVENGSNDISSTETAAD